MISRVKAWMGRGSEKTPLHPINVVGLILCVIGSFSSTVQFLNNAYLTFIPTVIGTLIAVIVWLYPIRKKQNQ